MNPCPDKHALGLYSKGLRSQNKAATPSRKFARSGAHFRSPRSKDSAIPTGNEFSKTGFILRAPQPKQGCYALAKVRAIRRSLFAHPVLRARQPRPATNFQRPLRALFKLSPAFWNAFRTCESAFLASFKTYVCNEVRDSGRSAAGFSPGLSLAGLGLLEAEMV